MTKKEEELLRSKEWMSTVINYLMKVEGKTVTLTLFLNIVNETADKNNIRGMRMLFRDVNEMATSLRESDLNGLNILLIEKFGEDLNSKNDLKKLDKILKKNVISNENEFHLVMDYVNQNFGQKDQQSLIESLNKLLANFEKNR